MFAEILCASGTPRVSTPTSARSSRREALRSRISCEMRRSERFTPSGESTCEWARSYTLDRPITCLLRVSRDAVKGSVYRASSYQKTKEPSSGQRAGTRVCDSTSSMRVGYQRAFHGQDGEGAGDGEHGRCQVKRSV